MADNDAKIFVYRGVGEGAIIPKDVVRVWINPSMLVIPERAFMYKFKLEEVAGEIHHDHLCEIGPRAFRCTVLNEVHVSDGVKIIGEFAFMHCHFVRFRCPPPLVTTIPYYALPL